VRPPICAICDKYIEEDDKGDLIQFKLTKDDKQWVEYSEKNDIIGHPPYLEWFCGEHMIVAQKYVHLNRQEAMQMILKEINAH